MNGPKHGMARGVPVYGTGCEPRRREHLLSQCRQLRSWAGLHGIILTGVPEDLARLDEAVGEWGGDPRAAGWLGGWEARLLCLPAR